MLTLVLNVTGESSYSSLEHLAKRTMTVGELRFLLECYSNDTPILIQNENANFILQESNIQELIP